MKRVLKSSQRRIKKVRKKILDVNNIPRLSVNLTLKHIYAQISVADGSKVLVVASTLDKEIAPTLEKVTPNKQSAAMIGQYIAKRAVAAGLTKISFDRSGHKYHGRIKVLADSARENGLIF